MREKVPRQAYGVVGSQESQEGGRMGAGDRALGTESSTASTGVRRDATRLSDGSRLNSMARRTALGRGSFDGPPGSLARRLVQK